MLCDECHENEAVIFYTEITGNNRTEKHLCESCAAKHSGIQGPFISLTDNAFLTNLLASVLGGKKEEAPEEEGEVTEENLKKTNLVCPECQMTYNEFIKFGTFGCPSCYKTFNFLLDSYLKRIQGNNEHTGKTPLYTGATVELPEIRKPDPAAETREDKDIAITVDEDSTEAELRAAIKRAVAREEYEEAARLRDLLRAGKDGQANE